MKIIPLPLFISIILCLIQLFYIVIGFDLRALLVGHLFLILSLIFLNFKKKFTLIFAALPIIILAWYLSNLEYILTRLPFVKPISDIELLFGLITIGLVMLGTWTTVGWPMTILTIFFLLYALFLGPFMPSILTSRAIPIREFIDYIFLGDGGIFGTPLYVSANFVYIFILFGSFLKNSGAAQVFNDIALTLSHKSWGGPAKASVIASSLFGTVSGSAVANVVMTGTWTIPLMMKTGYKPAMAAAVETVASTGGQIMPPIMGAAAFLMAYLLGMSYWSVAIAAALPAILYYAMVFTIVDLEARKYKIGRGLEVRNVREVLFSLYLLLPLILIITAIALFYDVPSAAYLASLLTLLIWSLLRFTSDGIRILASIFSYIFFVFTMYIKLDILMITIFTLVVMGICSLLSFNKKKFYEIADSISEAAQSILSIAMACASAGLIVGSLTLTGLSLKFTSILLHLSGGNIVVLLILTAIASYILGMGMPTTAVYITVVILLTSALITSGIPPLVAHMFAFYTAMLSMITPPVALAAFAAAGIAKEDPFKVGLQSIKLGFLLFILPFLFVYKPALLLIGSWLDILLSFFNTLISIFPISIAFVGYSFKTINIIYRALYMISGILILIPEIYTSILGLSLFIFLLIKDKYSK